MNMNMSIQMLLMVNLKMGMQRIYRKRYLSSRMLFLALMIWIMIYVIRLSSKNYELSSKCVTNCERSSEKVNQMIDPVKIAITCCGDEVIEQTLVLIKSALIFTKTFLHFIIISDVPEKLEQSMIEWPEEYLAKFTIDFIPPSFPNVTNPEEWEEAYKPCAAQRLFFPIILPHHDAVLHVDTDSLFLSPPEQLWSVYKEMNSNQIAGYAVDGLDRKVATYNINKTKYPIATELGLNSGVSVFNLTKIRQVNFFDEIQTILDKWGEEFIFLDQDLINVYFHDHPDRYLLLPCRFNFIHLHCERDILGFCPSAETEGISVLHGAGRAFSKHSSFIWVHDSFRDYELGTDLESYLLAPLKNKLTQDKNACSKIILNSL